MKTIQPTPPKNAKPLPPPPQPGGPAVSVPIEQSVEWLKLHGLKVIASGPNTWPPTLIVVQETKS